MAKSPFKKLKSTTAVTTFQNTDNDTFLLTINKGRLSYPHLATPQKDRDDPDKPGRYNTAIIVEESADSDAYAAIEDVLEQARKKMFPKLKKVKNSLHDGDGKADSAGYEGNFYISAANTKPPKLRVGNRTIERDDRDIEKFYAGANAAVTVKLWKQDNSNGKRINFSLEAVKWLGDNTPLGGATSMADDDLDAVMEDVADVEEMDDDPLA